MKAITIKNIDEALKAITIKNIDPELFRKFKVACAENSIDMRQAILDFMEHYPEKPKK